MKKISIIFSIVALLVSATSFAHNSRTDKSTCHQEETTSTSHCH